MKIEDQLFGDLDYLYEPRKRRSAFLSQICGCSTQDTFNFAFNNENKNPNLTQSNIRSNPDLSMDLDEKYNF